MPDRDLRINVINTYTLIKTKRKEKHANKDGFNKQYK